jgi:hypothetical protein
MDSHGTCGSPKDFIITQKEELICYEERSPITIKEGYNGLIDSSVGSSRKMARITFVGHVSIGPTMKSKTVMRCMTG